MRIKITPKIGLNFNAHAQSTKHEIDKKQSNSEKISRGSEWLIWVFGTFEVHRRPLMKDRKYNQGVLLTQALG